VRFLRHGFAGFRAESGRACNDFMSKALLLRLSPNPPPDGGQ